NTSDRKMGTEKWKRKDRARAARNLRKSNLVRKTRIFRIAVRMDTDLRGEGNHESRTAGRMNTNLVASPGAKKGPPLQEPPSCEKMASSTRPSPPEEDRVLCTGWFACDTKMQVVV